MAIDSFIDGFTLSSGAIGTTQVRTGYGHAPQVLFGVNQSRTSGVDAVGRNDSHMSIGAAISTTSRVCVDLYHLDVTNASSNHSGRSDSTAKLFSRGTASGAADINFGEWDVSAVGSDGFTSRVDTQGTGSTTRVLSLGGAAIAGIEIGSFAVPADPGTLSISGLSIEPSGILFLSTTLSHGGMAIGGASRLSGNQACSGCSLQQLSPLNAHRYSRSGESIVTTSNDPSFLISQLGSVTSWNPDGFDLTFTLDPLSVATPPMHFIAFQMNPGFAMDVLSGLTSTSAGAASLTTAANFTPEAGLVFSCNGAESTSGVIDNDFRLSVGMFSGTGSQNSTCTFSEHAATQTNVGDAIDYDSIYTNMLGGADPNALQGEMALTSLSNGAMGCNMTDADPVESFVWAFTIGTVPFPPRGSPIFF